MTNVAESVDIQGGVVVRRDGSDPRRGRHAGPLGLPCSLASRCTSFAPGALRRPPCRRRRPPATCHRSPTLSRQCASNWRPTSPTSTCPRSARSTVTWCTPPRRGRYWRAQSAPICWWWPHAAKVASLASCSGPLPTRSPAMHRALSPSFRHGQAASPWTTGEKEPEMRLSKPAASPTHDKVCPRHRCFRQVDEPDENAAAARSSAVSRCRPCAAHGVRH